jgi:hypothetical protein
LPGGRGARRRWQDDAVEKARFRHNVGIAVLGVVMLCGGVALAVSRWYLAPIELIPLAMIVWGIRAGTDVDADGLRLRALVGSRKIAWSQIDGFVPQGDKVLATLAGGKAVTLPAVSPADLPRLLRAGAQPNALTPTPPTEPDDDADTDATTGH